MLKKAYVEALCVFGLLITSAYGQQKPILESLVPPSPNAAELGKYGAYPVGMLTGVPDISFPLYEINTGKLKLPVTLSYHAAGIKVNQHSTDVGLGWTIMAGGTISRSVFGTPDDGQYGYFNYNPPSFQDLQNMSDFNTLQLYSLNPGYDLEPDLFVYNLAGKSGKFICRKTKDFLTIPFDPIQIQKSADGQNHVIFQITDDNGTIYQFNQYTYTFSESDNTTSITRKTISTWYLTKIISSDYADEIDFTYESSSVEDAIEQHAWPIGVVPDPTVGLSNPYHFTNGAYPGGGIEKTQTTVNYNELLVKQITFRNGYVVFNRNTARKDVELSANALDEMVVYNNQNQVVKKISFNHDNFLASPFNDDFQHYRLKLTGFVESDANNSLHKVYNFNYNSTALPPSGSYNQDYWGFYNGQNNQTLIPTNTVYGYDLTGTFSDGITYGTQGPHGGFSFGASATWTIGNANREPSSDYMQAGMLSKIIYPTGGYSLFEFEPHKYLSSDYVQQAVNKGGNTVGINKYTKSENSYSFTYPADPSIAIYSNYINATLTINFSATNMGNAVVDGPQIVTITDQTANITQTWTHSGDLTIAQTLNLQYFLIPSHSYVLTVTDYGDNSTFVNCSLYWNEITGSHMTKTGGGLRIKAIKNYDINNTLLKEENYVYGNNEEGLGTKIFDERNFYRNYENVVLDGYWNDPLDFAGSDPQAALACVNLQGFQRRYLGISQYSSINYMGSPVLYPSVSKYEGSLSHNIGKTVYNYNILQDPTIVPSDFVNSGNYGAINNAWNEGELLNETTYKNENNVYRPVMQNVFEYTHYNEVQEQAIRLKQYKPIIVQHCNPIETYLNRPGLGHFSMFQYPIITGASRKTKEIKKAYAPIGGSFLQTITTTQYLNPGHLYPSVVNTTLSDASQKSVKYFYPQDLSTSDQADMYYKLSNKNILNIPARTELSVNGSLLQADQTYFNNNFTTNTDQILPSAHTLYDKSNTATQTLNFKRYDQYGNSLEKELNGDVISNLFDYNSIYPVCEVKGAKNTDIAYTSFEADGTGNWNITTNTHISGGITGANCYDLTNGSISDPALTSGTTYIVSYWATTGNPLSISGTQGTATKGRTVNNWTYYEHKITGVTTVTIPQQTGVLIDELRLYPANAQMITYTYSPLIGMTSNCSANNNITYYEYDALGRLQDLKDQYGNVIKTFEYHYQGQ